MELPASSQGSFRKRLSAGADSSIMIELATKANLSRMRMKARIVALFDSAVTMRISGMAISFTLRYFVGMIAGYISALAIVLILAGSAIYLLCRGQRSR
jgi:hypothetical protein